MTDLQSLPPEVREAIDGIASGLDRDTVIDHIIRVTAERDAMANALETERMRLTACGVVAISDTPETATKARQMKEEYRSASCDDVARRVDECIALRQERDALARRIADAPVAHVSLVADGENGDAGAYMHNAGDDLHALCGADVRLVKVE